MSFYSGRYYTEVTNKKETPSGGKEDKIMTKKNNKLEVVLYVVLFAAVIANVVTIVTSSGKGMKIDWIAFGAVYAAIGCALEFVGGRERKFAGRLDEA